MPVEPPVINTVLPLKVSICATSAWHRSMARGGTS
jgi:hypothetical protein